jgi:hypothetical protein
VRREGDPGIFDLERKKATYSSGLNLREGYLCRIEEGMEQFSVRCDVGYEQLLNDPVSEVDRLLQVLEIPKKLSPAEIASLVDPNRTERFLKEEFSWIEDSGRRGERPGGPPC